jgi:hypothetical protein
MTGHLFLVKVDRSLIGQFPVIIGQKVGTTYLVKHHKMILLMSRIILIPNNGS